MSAIKNISLFIPHVYGNYTSSMVSDVFVNMNIGKIKNVDFVHKMGSDGKSYNAAYIHFYEWCDNIVSRNFQERVLNPDKEARVMYDDPWYWIVLENKSKKHIAGERKPRIDLGVFDGSNVKPSAEFACGKTQAKTESKSSNYIVPIQVKKTKSYSQVVKTIAPVNIEHQEDNDEITQEEMDWAFNQLQTAEMMAEMDTEDRYLASFDTRYVHAIEQENKMLLSQLSYFQNLYNIELIKTQALVDTIKIIKS